MNTNPLTEALRALAPEPGAHRHSIRLTGSEGRIEHGYCPGCNRTFWRDQRRRWFSTKREEK